MYIFVGCLLTAIDVSQSSLGIWASIALTAAVFLMVMSLYLLGEQKKDETKWLEEVGMQLGYFGGDVAA